jgi:phage recombination protein Bet
MTDALVVPEPTSALAVSAEQLALIKRTIAKDATDSELQLFLYDCQRRNTHPLDRLLHFSKRGGKYVPIVSIDFMRQRAAATDACAGIDDATFSGTPKSADFAARVTVWRLVQGQRCAFTATARWTEYKPDQDWMWLKMPHLMLGKTAEALALRRAFPTELAGVYVVEELEQADDGQAARGKSDAARPISSTPVDKERAPVEDVELPPPPRRQRDEYKPISRAQQKRLFAIARSKQWPLDALRAKLLDAFNAEGTSQLRQGDYDAAIEMVNRGPTPVDAPSREPGEDDIPF